MRRKPSRPSLGNSLGHVLRSTEHQTARLVPDFHRWEEVDEYADTSTILMACRSDAVLYVLVYRRNPKEKKETKEPKEPDTAQKQQSTLKVTDQYIALLIRVFVAAGLLDVSDKMVH